MWCQGSNASLCIFCAADGEILRVQQNEVFKKDSELYHRKFFEIIADADQHLAKDFVAEILRKRSAFNWRMTVKDNARLVDMIFTGALAANELVILAALDLSGPEINFYEELMKINNEQIQLFRAALSATMVETENQQEKSILDNLLRLNNELLDLQRALAKKNLEFSRTPDQYQFYSRDHYDFAYSFRVNADGRFQLEWINGPFESLSGYPIDASTFPDLLSKIILDEDQTLFQELQTALLEGNDRVVEFRIRTAKGDICWLRAGSHALKDSKTQQIYRIIGAAEDITTLKQAQEDIEKVKLTLSLPNNGVPAKEADQLVVFSKKIQRCESVEEAYEVIIDYGMQIFPDFSGELVLDIGKDPVCQWNGKDKSQSNLRMQITVEVINHSLGVLNLYSESNKAGFNELVQKMASTFAEQIGLSLSNLSLRDQLEQQATQDALTGLFNRRYLNNIFSYWLQRAELNELPISIIMVDIDHFKLVNDSFGHSIGDDMLVALSRLIKGSIRSSDLACRLGGEEFLLVLPDANPSIAFRRIEKIREEFAVLNQSLKPIFPTMVTFSAGIATYPQDGRDLDELLKNADRALYCAKQNGRNQTVITSEIKTDPFIRMG
jgi:diguanylate cyclase (GGDEF)-like protein/PAS domain S-box-containing protein